IAGTVADAQSSDALFNLGDELISNRVNRQHGRYSHAALTSSAVTSVDSLVSNQVQVSIRQHQHVVIRATERLHALAVLRRGFVDVLRNRSGAHKRDSGDLWAIEQAIDSQLVTLQDVEDTIRQACFSPQVRHPQCCRWRSEEHTSELQSRFDIVCR